jgi:hypothetical protein
MSAQPELWRVSTVEGVFETDLETLKQWIIEGCVLPTDKVSKGNLSWIDAGRVPKLKGAFNGETRPAPQPVNNSFEAFVESSSAYGNPPSHSTALVPLTVSTSLSASACQNHPDADPEFVCRACGSVFCKACPKLVGKIAVCPSCGDLCRDYRAESEKAARAEFQSSGFGMEDFVRAIRYPLQNKAALIGGALIYGALLMAGFRGGVLAWLLMFACISHVISQVSWGRIQRSFMPDLSEFSLWDDLVCHLLCGLGIMIVTWGPTIVLILAVMLGVLSGAGPSPSSLVTANQPAEAIQDEDFKVLMDPNADPTKLAEANKKLQQTRPGAQIAREAEKSEAEASDPVGVFRTLRSFIDAGILIAVLFLLCMAWGVFYYPMALAVAGYTQSFASVVNPLVGLDTIRRMRGTYFKAFGMVIAVEVVAYVVGAIIFLITSPFTLAFMGNMVGNFIYATFTFYFNLVIACILGLSLFKCADRLGINVD